MSCPTCDHTMLSLGKMQSGINLWWCARCGTLRSKVHPGFEEDKTPWLIERCRQMQSTLTDGWLDEWTNKGITEAINLPAERPT